MSQNIRQFLNVFEEYLEHTIDNLCHDSPLLEGMRYAVLGGGKRIRPTAVYLGARAVVESAPVEQILALATAVELIHAYSLVHDDLPAMDNDDMRRGKPSTHKKFGEANGILIGDALLTLAMRVLVEHSAEHGTHFAQAAAQLTKAAADMVDGQAFDLGGVRGEEEYLHMYSQKTGALIIGAFRAGAICAGAHKGALEQISRYALHLGLAFQLADDLLDDGEDNTIVSVIGAEQTKTMLLAQTQSAIQSAEGLENEYELSDFAHMLCTRSH